jgi:DNA polymerase-3 subunit gamma/tau
LELVRKGLEEGRSTPQATRDLVSHFRNLLYLKVGSSEVLELTRDYLERLQKQSEKFSLDKIKEVIRALSRAELDMKWHPHARLVLEVALLELPGERQPSETRTTQDVSHHATATDGRMTKIRSHWKDILESVKKKSIFGYVSLHEGEPTEINGKGKLVIAFRRGYAFHKDRLEEAKNKESVEEALREVAGEKIPIECVISDGKKEPSISAKTVAEFFEGRVL